MPILRRLTPDDAPAALHLASSVGWTLPPNYMEQLLRWGAATAWGIADDQQLVATGMAFRYEQQRAWIAMMMTHPAQQGQGLGRQIMETLLDELKGVREVMLDASHMGYKLYEKLGFRPLYSVRRWGGYANFTLSQPYPTIRPYQPDDLPALLALDTAIFGAKREGILQELAEAEPTWVDVKDGQLDGFLTAKVREGNYNLGAWIHRTPQGAEALFQTAQHHLASEYLTLASPDPNTLAVDLLRRYGFHDNGTCMRMVLGDDPTICNEQYYGIVTMAVG